MIAIDDRKRFSDRVENHFQALGKLVAGGVEWFWIAPPHEDYNKLMRGCSNYLAPCQPKQGADILITEHIPSLHRNISLHHAL